MKQHEGRGTRRLIVAVTLVMTLITGGLLLKGLAQETLAVAPAALEGSSKTASSPTVPPGGELTYQIVLSNTSGTTVTNVIVTDALPAGVTYIPLSRVYPEGIVEFSIDPGLRNLTFTAAAIGTAPITVSFRVTANASLQPGDVITNTAVITGDGVALMRSVAVTVEAPPTARIDLPWDNQLITQRGSFTVSGRVWTDSQTPEFPDAPVLDPIVSTQTFYNVTWSAVAGADAYVLQEADNEHFSDATDFPPTPTPSQFVTGKTAGTYYYRVKAVDAVYGSGFWSNVISHTVSTAMWAEAEAAIAPAPLSVQPAVEINIRPVGEAGTWVPVSSITAGLGDWWNWSYEWTLPEADNVQYVVQVRGTDPVNGADPSAGDAVTVTVRNSVPTIYLPLIAKRYPGLPFAPVLALAGTPSTGSYQLSWTYPHTELTPTSYRFQEALNADFTVITINEITSSPRAFTSKPGGRYYYRVRGVNAAGEGDWSNVVAVEVAGFIDDFSNPASGWPRETVNIDGRPVFEMNYVDGTYRAKILLNRRGLNNYLMGIARAPYNNPFSNYEVQTDHQFVEASDQEAPPEWGKSGLIFAATPDYTTLFVVEWNWPDGSCAVSKYTGVNATVVDIRRPGNGSIRQWGPCPISGGYNRVLTARVIVNGNNASVYVNNQLISTFNDPALSGARRVGVLTGSVERTPVEGRFDNFHVLSR
jgi:uncharacterized repeat protein (TIGR01451 family)